MIKIFFANNFVPKKPYNDQHTIIATFINKIYNGPFELVHNINSLDPTKDIVFCANRYYPPYKSHIEKIKIESLAHELKTYEIIDFFCQLRNIPKYNTRTAIFDICFDTNKIVEEDTIKDPVVKDYLDILKLVKNEVCNRWNSTEFENHFWKLSKYCHQKLAKYIKKYNIK